MLTKLQTPLKKCNLKFGETGVDPVTNGLFEGYAAVFGGIDSFGDTIMKGAFADTITDRDHPILMLYGHSSMNVVGKWIHMEEDDTGLYVQGEFTPNHQLASDVYASLKHGAMSGMSIGFRMTEDGSEEIEGGGRRISKVQLEEISIVGFPADSEARVATVKGAAEDINAIKSIRDSELFLRDAGFSRSMAKAFISQNRDLYQREADEELERKKVHDADLSWLRKLTDTR
jgi:HK97 family phage prohead protease